MKSGGISFIDYSENPTNQGLQLKPVKKKATPLKKIFQPFKKLLRFLSNILI